MRILLSLSFLVLTAACGPREPGFQPNETLIWELTSATVEFGQCSDSPEWRDGFTAVVADFVPGAFEFAVGMDSTGTQAKELRCTILGSCAIAPEGLTFAVAGTELFAGSNFKSPANEGSTCNVAVTQTALIEDLGPTMIFTDTLLYTLVDDEVECEEIDAYYRATSANRLGIQGCGVSFRYEGTLR